MLNKIKEFFFGKPVAPAPEAPYKIEAPSTDWPFPKAEVNAQASTQTKCGCGRSPSGFCVGLHALSAEQWAAHADNPAKTVAKKAPARAKKAPGEKPAARKPRAKKTPAK